MATSEQLEHQADATRTRIEQTLAELRTRLSPGLLMDEALGFAKENGGGDFVRNLGRQVSENPLPVALIGAGLAWLIYAQNRAADGPRLARSGNFKKLAERTKTMTNYEAYGRKETSESESKEGMRGKASEMVGRASEAMGSARDRASDMVDRARETTSGAYGRVSRSVSSAVDTVSSAMPSTRSFANFMQDEPIVLAGIGVALGAIIGAMLPSTDIEERYIGPTAESLKEQAKEVAREQWERGKEVAAEGWDEAKEAARRTWEDAKDEAQKSWDATREKAAGSDNKSGQTSDMTGAQTPLVPSEPGQKKERMADATSRGGRSGS